MRGFDAVRDKADGIPSASAICQRLGRSWPRVLDLAVRPVERRAFVLGLQKQTAPFVGDMKAAAVRSIREVALELGQTPSAVAYDELTRGRRGVGGSPNSLSVTKCFGSWDEALAAAAIPAAGRRTGRPRLAAPLVDTIERCVATIGCIPSLRYLRRWAAAMDIPTPHDHPSIAAMVETVRHRFAECGQELAAEVSRAPACPPIPAALPPQRRRHRATRIEALDSLRRYASLYVPVGQVPRQKHYVFWAAQTSGLVAASTLTRFGHFQDLCREAGIA